MVPNQATAVETSQKSHIVMSPISSHYHHHHPPPPPCTAATATIEPPSDCPHLGQSRVGSSMPPSPNDQRCQRQLPMMPHHWPPMMPTMVPDDAMSLAPNDTNDTTPLAANEANDTSRRHYVIGCQHQRRLPTMPRHQLPTMPHQPKVAGKLGRLGTVERAEVPQAGRWLEEVDGSRGDVSNDVHHLSMDRSHGHGRFTLSHVPPSKMVTSSSPQEKKKEKETQIKKERNNVK